MPNTRMIKSVLSEYGAGWAFNRSLYSIKLKSMGLAPPTEKWYEKRTPYPKRLDIFDIDVDVLQSFLKEKLSEKDQKKLEGIADKACKGVITGFSSSANKGHDGKYPPLHPRLFRQYMRLFYLFRCPLL